MDWEKLKKVSEKKFQEATIGEYWGFQIQKGTKWNNGLNHKEIEKLEALFGFKFPNDYLEMLRQLNGFDTPNISIDPEGNESPEYHRNCYKYPDDFYNLKEFINQINNDISFVEKALKDSGINYNKIEGFIPLYGHRLLVVFNDKLLSPVISAWGNDIIIYGGSLLEYWCKELYIDFESIK